ncbi:MAG: phage tail terminator-like protein [Smithella sp.]|nr:phage tail terminator-like protein [Smithella sp.]
MSLAAIRAALETRLNNMASPISYAWENTPFTPVAGVPYAAIYLMPATPDNPTMGDGFYREQGIFQISLFYPLQTGPKAAIVRGELIREAFKRGSSLVSGTVIVRIFRTPEIGQGRIEGDRWHLPCKIQFFADIHN